MDEADRGPTGNGAVLPPGPRSPAIVQVLNWLYRPVPMLAEWHRRYGDTFTLRFPAHPPYVLTSDPEAIREIFRSDPDDVHSGDATRMLEPVLGPHSLILLDGAAHRRERRLMAPTLHGERMRAYGETMRDATIERLSRWPVGRRFSLRPEMQELTLEIILRTVFGLADDDRHARIGQRIKQLLAFTSNPLALILVDSHGKPRLDRLHRMFPRWSPVMRFASMKRELDRQLYEEFEVRREGAGERSDVLSMLLEARYDDGRRMTYAALRDELLTLLMAGHETTATALCWVFYRLWRHDDVRERVRDELARVAGDGPLAPDSVSSLSYLQATIRETLRLHPILPLVARGLTRPLHFAGLELPAGVIVAPDIYTVHRRPELWPDPERFDPERFLDDAPGRSLRYLPFGGGHRTCLGMAFAQYEMTVVTAQALRLLDYRVPDGYRLRIVRRSVTLAPAGGLPIEVVAKAPA